MAELARLGRRSTSCAVPHPVDGAKVLANSATPWASTQTAWMRPDAGSTANRACPMLSVAEPSISSGVDHAPPATDRLTKMLRPLALRNVQAAVALPAASMTTVTSSALAAPINISSSQPAVAACGWKVALTAVAAESTTLQVLLLPLQAPAQLPNVNPLAGVAVKVTAVPESKLAEQLALQLSPAGLEVTVPLPEIVTLSARGTGAATNVAVTDRAAASVTAQVGVVPVQAPDQPLNCCAAAGVAVSVTVVFAGNVAEQVVPQLMPAGLDETVPLPAVVTDSA